MPTSLHRVVYCSHSLLTRGAEEADIAQILAASRRNNPPAGVTGALLFRAGLFAQVLEGPRDAVGATFERIQRDPRHGEVIVLRAGPAAERGFPDWSMAYLGPVAGEAARWSALLGPTTFDPARLDGDRVFAALRDLVGEEDEAVLAA